MDAALTTLREEDIQKHLPTAQSLVTKTAVVEAASSKSKTELAGTRRRFVQTVSTSGAKSSRNVELAATLNAITPGDNMLSVAQHNVLFKTRRAIAVALAVSDVYAKQTGMDALRAKNASATLQGEEAERFRSMLEASAYVTAFTAAAYVKQMVDATGEPTADVEPPHFDFSTPQDALKGFVACLEAAAASSADDSVLLVRIREAAEACLMDLLVAQGPLHRTCCVREHPSATRQ